MTDDAAFCWPTTAIPALRVAGHFPLQERAFATTYRGPTHALHLHGYLGTMRLADRAFALADGDLTFSPAGVASAYDLPQGGHHWCVHFHPAPDGAGAGPEIHLPLHGRLGPAAPYVRERLAHIARLHARATAAGPGEALAAAAASVALLELLLWWAERTAAPAGAPQIAERAAAIIDARFAEPLAAARLGGELGVSQNYLARLFRQRFGVTIPHYVLQRRLEHARYLLESTDLPVGRIAERVGIADPQYFNKQARRVLGAAPSAIRRRAQGLA